MESVRFAVIGGGGFAFFAVTEFVKVPGVELAGVYDEIKTNSRRFTSIDSRIRIYDSADELLRDTSVDLVYIATPPFLHYAQSRAALLSGKHVICEKPAAIRLEHAVELRNLATQNNLLFVVNLMQRYNPLFDVISELIANKVLGQFLHGYFENYASDESLTPDHWFWDEAKSGGIFIEHGVHFFDLFAGWLGTGQIVSAQKLKRVGSTNVWDRVQAVAMYNGGIVNFYHGFDQPKVLDRQEIRLQFERGEITLYEWVPTRLRMTALCSEEQLRSLQSRFPEAMIDFIDSLDEPKTTYGRFSEITYQYKISLDTGSAIQKQDVYQYLLRRMFDDQLAWIHDRSHRRRITDNNAVASLELAETAERMAVKFE